MQNITNGGTWNWNLLSRGSAFDEMALVKVVGSIFIMHPPVLKVYMGSYDSTWLTTYIHLLDVFMFEAFSFKVALTSDMCRLVWKIKSVPLIIRVLMNFHLSNSLSLSTILVCTCVGILQRYLAGLITVFIISTNWSIFTSPWSSCASIW